MSDLIIPGSIMERLLAHCRSAYPNEACGILAGSGKGISHIYKTGNVDPSPVSYLMDPAEQFRIMKDMRERGLDMKAIFHSHPQSPAFPSAKDISLAFYDEVYYVIAGLMNLDAPEVRAFRIRGEKVEEALIQVADDQAEHKSDSI